MATLVLTAAGSAFGPLGGAVGALLGRTIDARIFGRGSSEGPRLKELAVSGSSYGTPIARHYGSMRAPGTILWATGFKEHRNTAGGGKGSPKTTSYSYSVSFAVALSSRPIDRIGRIWADGNLLRGAAGDLKSGGRLRIHTGSVDQQRDPLLEAALGAQCPAHRGTAYAVFEDLDLTDFGNRIPALSFEIFAGAGASMIDTMLREHAIDCEETVRFAELAGFSQEGGSLADVLGLVGRLHPLTTTAGPGGLRVAARENRTEEPSALPPPAAWEDGEFGRRSGRTRSRTARPAGTISALRYYDVGRDYQPGLQHAGHGDPAGHTLEVPVAMRATDAIRLARQITSRERVRRETIAYRMCALDPAIVPGSLVRESETGAVWQVAAWEWRAGGIELELIRYRPLDPGAIASDPGTAWTPPDRAGAATTLRIFELPWDGSGQATQRRAYAALGAGAGRWSGARLYAVHEGSMADTGIAGVRRAVTGRLATPLASSPALRFEPQSAATLLLDDPAAELPVGTTSGLAQWHNRLLIGDEVVQFARAVQHGPAQWAIEGLLRGRGGTESAALRGHPDTTPVTLLDERLLLLDRDTLDMAGDEFASLGPTDEAPVLASLEERQASLRPPSPVHGALVQASDGSVVLRWQRRARGGWAWLDEVEQPLVEQDERYEIGLGPVGSPHALWSSVDCGHVIDTTEVADLSGRHRGEELWVRQIGTFARSFPLLLGRLP